MASLSGTMPNCRRLYGAQGEDRVLIGADYKQLELWTGYVLTGDEVLGSALRDGDVYTTIAKQLFRLPGHLVKCECKGLCKSPTDHLKAQARTQAKIGFLAWRYAATFPTFFGQMLQEDQELPVSTGRLVYDGLGKTFVRTKEWWQEEMERVEAQGWRSISKLLGIEKTYPLPPKLQEVVNWPNQTLAAEIHSTAWVALGSGRKGKGGILAKTFGGEALLVKQWYDAFLVEAPKVIASEVAEVVQSVMEAPVVIDEKEWSFKVSIATGRHESDV